MMKLYKFLTTQHTGGYTSFSWSPYLPKNGHVGKWTPNVKYKLVVCDNGYHLVDNTQLMEMYMQAELYEAERRGKLITTSHKYITRQVRLVHRIDSWNDSTLRLFACWCVREIWNLLDDRSKFALEVAEQYAVGKSTDTELNYARYKAGVVLDEANYHAARASSSYIEAVARAAARAAWVVTSSKNSMFSGHIAHDSAEYAVKAVSCIIRSNSKDEVWKLARKTAGEEAKESQQVKLLEMLGIDGEKETGEF